jgi:gas vesicle protein
MITQQRGIDDQTDPWSTARSGRGAPGGSSLLLATLLGVGIGLLTAPQPGSKTRKLLLKRLAALGEEVGEGLEDVEKVSSKARKRAKERLAKLRENAEDEWEDVEERWEKTKGKLRDYEFRERDHSSPVGTILAIAAGLAATYLLTSDRAAPVRSRVQEAASDVKRRATDQWDRFQRGGTGPGRERSATHEARSEPRAGSASSDEAPQAS